MWMMDGEEFTSHPDLSVSSLQRIREGGSPGMGVGVKGWSGKIKFSHVVYVLAVIAFLARQDLVLQVMLQGTVGGCVCACVCVRVCACVCGLCTPPTPKFVHPFDLELQVQNCFHLKWKFQSCCPPPSEGWGHTAKITPFRFALRCKICFFIHVQLSKL